MKQNFTVRRGALDGIEMFLAVARHRSFRRAAAELGVTPSAASQAVRGLEGRLGVVLLARTTRSVGLTEAGARFLADAAPAYEALAAAGVAASDFGGRPAGRLRLAVPRAIFPLVLRPTLASFTMSYPDIELDISESGELVDIAAQGFDAGIRMGQFIANDMITLRLTPPFRMVIVGSPEYLSRRGIAESPVDLKHHACLRLHRSGGGMVPWRLLDRGRPLDLQVRGPFIAGDYLTLLDAAVEGIGLAHVPEPIAAEAVSRGKLRPILPAFAAEAPGMFLYYPDRRQVLPKLRAFIDHMRKNLPSMPSIAGSH
jgi:DNA-binding transcriptional LysR family regulator